jgi:hypothetical protein
MIRSFSPSLLFCLFLFTGCECTVEVSGTVINLYTNEPIAGAYIVGIGPGIIDIVTDSTGTFEFEELSQDDCEAYNVKVQAQGYSEKTVAITNGSHIEIRLDTLF